MISLSIQSLKKQSEILALRQKEMPEFLGRPSAGRSLSGGGERNRAIGMWQNSTKQGILESASQGKGSWLG
jgi:hypothetical protein